MIDSISFLAPDGMLEFEAADIEEIATDDTGTHVRLKDGHTCSLLGHEARALLESVRRAQPA
ncbi:MAG TPA: hypothetical protein VKH46_11610 [Thermoanaerobaculia bacterium]|jgi:hypothetical protein|nr:hypothetical protein [Thermoanaerobaculia bacterium]